MAIDRAHSYNMPNDNIDRAIKRASGELPGRKLEEFIFDAYGPEGIALVIEGITDNRNRTLSEIKQILNQYNGKLVDEGAVRWMFERKGCITIDSEKQEGGLSGDKEGLELTAIEAGAEKVIALCPCCEFQFRVTVDKKKLPVEITDLANFSCQALGYDFPDPNPEVQKQWAVFEGMIALMSPGGFAELMKTMWPELIDAMPFKMGRMMRVMGRIPGMLKVMKPMFPVLFPVLLPKMMPEVMPVMLDRISERIPMPDYMQEQMPEMMPKIMDNLMPHMVRDVVTLVSQPMIDYLSGKNGKQAGDKN